MRGYQRSTGRKVTPALTSIIDEREGGRSQMRIPNVLVVRSTSLEVDPEIDADILETVTGDTESVQDLTIEIRWKEEGKNIAKKRRHNW